MKFFPIDARGLAQSEIEIPDPLMAPYHLPLGTFVPPPVADEGKVAVLTDAGWRVEPFSIGIWYKPNIEQDDAITAIVRHENEGLIGVDLAADGWTQSEPPTLAVGEKLEWDATNKNWKVVAEPPEAKTAREAAAKVAARASMSLTNVELATALFKAGKITGPEAEDFAGTGAIPASMLTAINGAMTAAGMPAEAQTLARVTLKGLMVYQRTSPLVPVIGAALQMSEDALDVLFSAKQA